MRSVLGALIVLALAGAARAEPAAERRTELLYMLKHDCGSCHGMTLKGGLGSPLSPDVLAARDSRDLVEIILNGIPGTPMPPWRPLLSNDDAAWLAGALKQGRGLP